MTELDGVAKSDSKVNGQYRFHSHDDVTAALHPLLVKHGITMIPTVTKHTQEGNRTEAEVSVVFSNADDPSNDNFVVQYFGYGVDSGDKGPGKAISYACKYAALKTFCLSTGDDPDKDAKAKFEPQKCTMFDDLLPEKTNEKLMQKFLEYSAEAMDKHVEDVKREAVKRMDDFMNGFNKWTKKQKETV
jgi:hypothetical protein